MDSDLTLSSTATLSGYIFNSSSSPNSTLTIEDSADVSDCSFYNVNIQGVLDGGSTIYDSTIKNITYFNGHIHESMLMGTITLNGGVNAHIDDCSQMNVEITPEIIMVVVNH